MRIIKFTTCLAVNALNTLILHLSFSLSPRYLPMIYLESCITKFPQFGDMCHCDCHRNMPIPPSYTLMFPHTLYYGLSFSIPYSLREQILNLFLHLQVNCKHFNNIITVHLAPCFSLRFIFYKTIFERQQFYLDISFFKSQLTMVKMMKTATIQQQQEPTFEG